VRNQRLKLPKDVEIEILEIERNVAPRSA